MKYSGQRKLLCEFSKLSKLNPGYKTNTDASILFTNSAQYVRRVYTTAINFPCISTLHLTKQTTNS